MDCDVVSSEALLLFSVEVVRQWIPSLTTGVDQGIQNRVPLLTARYLEQSATSAVLTCAQLMLLHIYALRSIEIFAD